MLYMQFASALKSQRQAADRPKPGRSSLPSRHWRAGFLIASAGLGWAAGLSCPRSGSLAAPSDDQPPADLPEVEKADPIIPLLPALDEYAGAVQSTAAPVSHSAGAMPTTFCAGKLRTRVANAKGMVAITFDDGPSPECCEAIMQVLASENVSCTFFLIGDNAARNPNLVREMHLQGHEVGNHSSEHQDMRSLSFSRQRAVIRGCQGSLRALLPYAPHYFRPPNGSFSSTTLNAAKRNNCEVICWSIDPRDWSARSSADTILEACGRAASGDIILLHERKRTAELLPQIIHDLRGRGLEPVTISTLINSAPE
jgi:peptidoglycan-N-acetylglucosamine deacetylase